MTGQAEELWGPSSMWLRDQDKAVLSSWMNSHLTLSYTNINILMPLLSQSSSWHNIPDVVEIIITPISVLGCYFIDSVAAFGLPVTALFYQ